LVYVAQMYIKTISLVCILLVLLYIQTNIHIRRLFYCDPPAHIPQKACIRRHIPWQLPCSRWWQSKHSA